MLYLEQNTINELTLVVNDVQLLDNPFYLWRFEHEVLEQEFLIFLSNQLPFNRRADRFILDLPNDLDLPTGTYRYYVYESETEDLDYTGLNELTANRLLVNTNFPNDTIYENDGQDYVYKGNES